ncbi:hypothetical protein TrCOL_g3228 [Triparma columacea]|uniref:Kinesin light chain n=1 Tax=Triparma columacea TaxID=722753 RepID=A0A9W7L5F1_9STRA|nr:hypothetical protein TrCOL_g3228 [Triparma columacea]
MYSKLRLSCLRSIRTQVEKGMGKISRPTAWKLSTSTSYFTPVKLNSFLQHRNFIQLTHSCLDAKDSLGEREGIEGIKEGIEVEVTKTTPQPTDETKDVIRSLMELQRELKRALESGSAGSFSTTLPDTNQEGVRKLEANSSDRDALTVAKEILQKTAEVFPESSPHPALARAYNDYGYVLKTKEEYHQSIEAYHRSIQLYEESLGRRSRGYATAMRNTSTCYKDYAFHVGAEGEDSEGKKAADVEMEKMGLLSRAREAGEEALKWSKEWEELVAGHVEKGYEGDDDEEGHKFTEKDLLDARRDRVGAAFSLSAVLAAQSRALGGSKVGGKTKTKKGGKTKATIAGNILKKAEKTCRGAIKELAEMEGIEYIDLLQDGTTVRSLALANGMNTLGVILSLLGSKHSRDKTSAARHYHEAESFYIKAYECRSKSLKPGHPDVITSLFNLAEVADRMGREEDANKIREYVLEEIRGGETEEERARREIDETLDGLDFTGGLGGGSYGGDGGSHGGSNFR